MEEVGRRLEALEKEWRGEGVEGERKWRRNTVLSLLHRRSVLHSTVRRNAARPEAAVVAELCRRSSVQAVLHVRHSEVVGQDGVDTE